MAPGEVDPGFRSGSTFGVCTCGSTPAMLLAVYSGDITPAADTGCRHKAPKQTKADGPCTSLGSALVRLEFAGLMCGQSIDLASHLPFETRCKPSLVRTMPPKTSFA
jgi:hypothetical protein